MDSVLDDREDPDQKREERGPVRETAEGLDTVLDDILEDGTRESGDDPDAREALQELIDPEEIAALLGDGDAEAEDPSAIPGADPAPQDISPEEVAGLMEDVYAEGRRLERLGECVLMVSRDGLSAFLRGSLPNGTVYEDVVELLNRAGIGFGIIPDRIYDALPYKKATRGRPTRRTRAPSGRPEGVVAEGRPPVPPQEAHIEYHFREVTSEEVEEVKGILGDYDFGKIRACSISLSLVRPEQVLAEVIQDLGECGRNVFGQEIPPDPPPEVTLNVGENVVLDEEGHCCTAEICGYAGILQGAITVLPALWISQDLLRGFFIFLPQVDEYPIPTVDDLNALLEGEGVVHGIDQRAIADLGRNLQQKAAVDRATQIVRGTDAVPGQSAEWKFFCDRELTKYFGEILRILNQSPHVGYLEEYTQGLGAVAAAAGEPLATKQLATEGEMGTDVFGEEFLPEGAEDAELEAGEHIRFAEDGMACFAEIYGYLGIGTERIEIISPLWITPDQMAAYFVNLHQLGERHVPTPEEIDLLLERASVQYGIDHREIGVFCEKMKQDIPVPVAVLLARGKDPKPGVEGRFEYAFDVEQKPGLFAEDGSIDFKQLNMMQLLKKGQLIGTRIPAEKGIPGMDVTGREIPTEEGQDVIVHTGKNVRLEREKGKPDRFVADIDGGLTLVEKKEKSPPLIFLAVLPTLEVSGDVDYNTGNIDHPGNVHIKGSIRSGFAVKAEGNVVVGDSVENHTTIVAGGNVAVKNGITGTRTRIVARGSVFAKFINTAHVRLKGALVIAEYIFNASVRADESISVVGTTGKRNSGVIAGGFAVAGRQISVQSIGTEAGSATQIVAGVDSTLLQQVAGLQKQIDRCRTAIGQMLRALEVESMDPAQIRNILLNLVLKAKGSRRKFLARAAKNVLALQARLKEAIEKKKERDEELQERAFAAAIEVSKTVAVDTVVKIGGYTQTIQENATKVTFALVEEEETVRLQRVST